MLNKQKSILCAISGGLDSTVMLHYLLELNYNCIVAHCNFQLRGKESDLDQEFVSKLAKKMGLKFISEKFDTVEYAKSHGISTQMAARDLRFEWFYKMAKKYNCEYIALAHNADDQAETMIFNLTRGTGIRGLAGMKTLKGKLFRPLLNLTRKEIEDYAKENNIQYREDSTNKETKYSRNKIRHKIMPILEEINPNFKENAYKASLYIQDATAIFDDYIIKTKMECTKYIDDKIYISVEKIKNTPAPRTLLFEILCSESLPGSFASEVLDLLDSQSGKKCKYYNIEVLRDRDNLIIKTDKSNNNQNRFHIDLNSDKITHPIKLEIKIEKIKPDFKISKSSNYAFIDFDKLQHPIELRKWEDGDKFQPLGMNNFKKLSDFFIDNKYNIFQKSEQWILTSKNDIVWIVGARLDNRFKITPNSKTALILKL